LPEGAVPLGVRYGEAIVLHGARFPETETRPGDAFPIEVYWETDRALTERDDVMVWLRMIEESPAEDDPARGVVGVEDAYPGAGTFPVSLWPANQLLASRQYVLVGADTPAPMVARLDLALYKTATGDRLAHPGGDLPTIGRVKIVPRRWPRVRRNGRVAVLGDGLVLTRYAHDGQASAGGTLPVRLTWAVQSRPRRDYAVFVHLVDDQGNVWGYGDGAPRKGNYSTAWWDEGEVIVDEHEMAIASDAPAGQYTLLVGMYDAEGRLPATEPDGTPLPNDAVVLGTVEVK
jgi:hypothetical protein